MYNDNYTILELNSLIQERERERQRKIGSKEFETKIKIIERKIEKQKEINKQWEDQKAYFMDLASKEQNKIVLKSYLKEIQEIDRRISIMKAYENDLNYYKGEDFYFTINDNFSAYKVYMSEIEGEENLGKKLLERFKEEIVTTLSDMPEDNSLEIRKKMVLEKLLEVVEHNIDYMDLGYHDEDFDEDSDEKYPIVVEFIGTPESGFAPTIIELTV